MTVSGIDRVARAYTRNRIDRQEFESAFPRRLPADAVGARPKESPREDPRREQEIQARRNPKSPGHILDIYV